MRTVAPPFRIMSVAVAIFAGAAAFPACGGPAPVRGTLDVALAKLPLDQLTERSAAIVQGKVLSVGEARWNTPDGSRPEEIGDDDFIYRDVTVLCLASYKGPIAEGRTFTVRMRGGTVGQDSFAVEDQAFLAIGETAYLLLNPPYWDDTPNVWSVWPTGVFTPRADGSLADQFGENRVTVADFVEMATAAGTR